MPGVPRSFPTLAKTHAVCCEHGIQEWLFLTGLFRQEALVNVV